MKKQTRKSLLSLVLCLVLLAAAALSVTALAEDTPAVQEKVILMNGTKEAPVALGEGKTVFLFEVTDPEGADSWFEIHTDAETVGAALKEQELIAGTDSEYGLMVTDVCGIHVEYTADNPHYWAFYINGAYAQTGVDSTPIEAGAVYLFKAE